MNPLKLSCLLLVLLLLTTCEEQIVTDKQFVKIHFHYGFANELNTFENIYCKDLVLDGVAAAEFWLTTDEQEEILVQAANHHFYELPDTIHDEPGTSFDPDPGRQFLRIQHQAHDHTVSWYYPLPQDSIYVPHLRILRDFLIELIESKPAYLSLPPARGGYI